MRTPYICRVCGNYVRATGRQRDAWRPDKFGNRMEVVEVEYYCEKDQTVYTFWYRKDGQPGDLYLETLARKAGNGPPIVPVLPGRLDEIQDDI